VIYEQVAAANFADSVADLGVLHDAQASFAAHRVFLVNILTYLLNEASAEGSITRANCVHDVE